MWEPSVYRPLKQASTLLIFSIGLGACSVKPPSLTASCGERVSTIYNGPGERSYCTTVSVPGTPVTIFGEAKYEAWTLGVGGLTVLAEAGTAKDIRYAEVEILDSSGNRVQCGQTDANGDFSLDVPSTTGTYTVRINSRSAKLDSFTTPLVNPVIHASVLNCPEENGVYSVSKTVTPSVDPDVGTITATYDGDTVGAAFNIYDQFVSANIFLSDANQAGNCSAMGCTNFTVAPKVSAYWAKGFNPNSYFGETADGISFYLPGYSRLFIMGGVSGDVDDSDTDHWDNAVILHEYGHFLEDAYTETDSPGGAHSGTSQIDPRLAWSEGWGNFIQAAIRGIACYTDTEGNGDGVADYIFNIPLQNGSSGCSDTVTHTNFDMPSTIISPNDGEGNFREFTISRFLYDIFDSDGDDGINNEFDEIWSAITSASGFNDTSENFRAIGLLNEVQQTLAGHSDWSSVRSTHEMASGRQDYALPVAVDSAAPTTDCDATAGIRSYLWEPPTSGSTNTADLLRRNDFYFYKHPGGALTMQLIYETPLGTEADVDLRVYNQNARLFRSDRADEVFRAEDEPDGLIATVETETASTSLAAGDYLIQVLVFTSGSEFTYDLKVNTAAYPAATYPTGVFLCPQ